MLTAKLRTTSSVVCLATRRLVGFAWRIEATEIEELRASGVAVTDFSSCIDPDDPVALADAIDTIREHHPGQAVWVDGSPAA